MVLFLLVIMNAALFTACCRYIEQPIVMPVTGGSVAGEKDLFATDSECLSDKALIDAQKEIQSTEQKCPVAQVLPYGGPFDGAPFFIHRPRADGTILVEIDTTIDFDAAKEAAKQWIRDQGYDPDNLGCKIIFRASNFSE
jgi:hypothetical protein